MFYVFCKGVTKIFILDSESQTFIWNKKDLGNKHCTAAKFVSVEDARAHIFDEGLLTQHKELFITSDFEEETRVSL